MAATIRARGLCHPGEAVLVALSGGPDSTALAAALAALREGGLTGPVTACHVDHRLRPGGDGESAHCAALAARLGIGFLRRAVSVKRGNVQSQARRARYRSLGEAADEVGAARIATGHTRGDQAETVLLRLLRGAGARGLAGIPPRRGRLIRPLIDRTRPEVMAYLSDRGLPWLEDPSNASDRYLRNRLRRQVLPALTALAPGAESALARAADLLREDDRALEGEARALFDARGLLRRVPAAAARPAVLSRAVVRLWREATGSRKGLSRVHLAAVARLVRDGRGEVALPGGRVARLSGGALALDGPAAGHPGPRSPARGRFTR